MNKITLITSEGCAGCEVMKNSINSAIQQAKVDVKLEVMDIKHVNKKFIKTYHINDTPCALFFRDYQYLFKKIGSVPSVVVVQWINVHFK